MAVSLEMHGIYPAMVTPMRDGGGRVDYECAEHYARWLADKGVHGLFVAGTTGEGLLLSLEERERLAEAVVRAVGDRIGVVIQAGCLGTRDTIRLVRHTMETGAKAAAIVSPGFFKYDAESLFLHFKMVLDAAPECPILLYDIPRCSGNPIPQEVTLRLLDCCGNLKGMKDSTGDIKAFNHLRAAAPDSFIMFNGTDDYTMQALFGGAQGSVASKANIVPELFVEIYDAMQAGDREKALAAQQRLNQVTRIFDYGAGLAAYKEALRLLGFDTGSVRPPQRELLPEEQGQLRETLHAVGLI